MNKPDQEKNSLKDHEEETLGGTKSRKETHHYLKINYTLL